MFFEQKFKGIRMMEPLHVQIKRIDEDLPLPRYAQEGDAGLDLYSTVDVDLQPGQRSLIPTGIAVSIPKGYAGFVQPRSGLALREGLSLVNTPGLIDSGYRGEIKVVAINTDPDTTIHIKRADRIAQLVIQEVPCVQLEEVETLEESERSDTGFGSTGK